MFGTKAGNEEEIKTPRKHACGICEFAGIVVVVYFSQELLLC